jgi:hypothetical protein
MFCPTATQADRTQIIYYKELIIDMPRTDIEQSRILPENQAIPASALQKALQPTRNWPNCWRGGQTCRVCSN